LQTVRHRFNIYVRRGVGHRKSVTRFGVTRRV